MTPKILDSSKEPIPDDEPDLNWLNQETDPTGAEPERFDQSRIGDPKNRHEKILLKGDVPDAPSPIKSPKENAFDLRISHRRYEETVGMDLPLRKSHQTTSSLPNPAA